MPDSSDLSVEQSLPASLKLLRELPGGGMARVFLAEDLTLGRQVVLKVLGRDLLEGLSQDRFRREIQIAAQLSHPHLVPVLQAGEADGHPYYVMPYVEGESLRGRLAGSRPLPVREAVSLLRDVARAMTYAHARGVVHRDIKPDNVLVAGGAAMVTDFGIAKALSSSRASGDDLGASLTRAGSSLGTPAYMAPEQAAADPAADSRVDLYSFGVMAYELLTGRPPFHDRAPQALLTAHLIETPVPLDRVVPGLPPGLVALVMQCLEKDPARRPAGAQQIVDRLDQLDWSGEQSVARSGHGRKRAMMAGTALFTVVLALLGGWLWRRGAVAKTALNRDLVAVVPFRVASADPALHYLREGMIDLLAAKLPGDGGLEATDPRLLLDAWREAGGKPDADLPVESARGLARRLGAGWLLQGDVVGTPSRVTLNGTLHHMAVAGQTTRVSVEGPPDSLGALVDDFVVRLLTSASQGLVRGTTLTHTSLPALRAYLNGIDQLRRGLPGSVPAFHEALEHDSTFALAALGLVQATGWFNDQIQTGRGLRIAWTGRDQLSARDLALLEATAGPAYPARSSTRSVFEAAQRYLQLAPERADAWYQYGDKLYHFGEALGVPDRAAKAADAFRRALALDSMYVPGYIHLQQLAVELGDTALDHQLERLRAGVDTFQYWRGQLDWARAAARGDAAELRRVWGSLPPRDNSLLYYISRSALFTDGTGAPDMMPAMDSLIARSPTLGGGQGNHRVAAAMALTLGRPRLAATHAAEGYGSVTAPGYLARTVLDALFDAGDTVAAATAAKQLTSFASGPVPRDSAGRANQILAARTVATWRLVRGDTAGARPLLERLRAALPPLDSGAPDFERLWLVALDALYANRTRNPAAADLTLRLDSLLAVADYTLNTIRFNALSLLAARLVEKYQTPEAALATVRRRAVWWNNEVPYLAAQLRETGRLAALAGEKEEARAAYGHYLKLRYDPEPEVRPEVERVRAELGKLDVEQ